MTFARLRKQAKDPDSYGKPFYFTLLPDVVDTVKKFALANDHTVSTTFNLLMLEALEARAKKAKRNTPNLNGFSARRGTIQ